MNNFYPKELTSVAGSEVTIIYKLVICQAFSITKQGVKNFSLDGKTPGRSHLRRGDHIYPGRSHLAQGMHCA